jgi:hypothetical protein
MAEHLVVILYLAPLPAQAAEAVQEHKRRLKRAALVAVE